MSTKKKQVTKQKQQQAAAKNVPAAPPIAYDNEDMSDPNKEKQNTS